MVWLIGTFVAYYLWLYLTATGTDYSDRLDYYFDFTEDEDDLDDRTKESVEKYEYKIPEYTEKQRTKDSLGYLLLFLFIMFLISYFLY